MTASLSWYLLLLLAVALERLGELVVSRRHPRGARAADRRRGLGARHGLDRGSRRAVAGALLRPRRGSPRLRARRRAVWRRGARLRGARRAARRARPGGGAQPRHRRLLR